MIILRTTIMTMIQTYFVMKKILEKEQKNFVMQV